MGRVSKSNESPPQTLGRGNLVKTRGAARKNQIHRRPRGPDGLAPFGRVHGIWRFLASAT